MLDKTILVTDLKKLFIHYQYRLENPMPVPGETEQVLISKYLRDPVFHKKVDSLVYGVMDIVDKHI